MRALYIFKGIWSADFENCLRAFQIIITINVRCIAEIPQWTLTILLDIMSCQSRKWDRTYPLSIVHLMLILKKHRTSLKRTRINMPKFVES
jgi:hypothetical protein